RGGRRSRARARRSCRRNRGTTAPLPRFFHGGGVARRSYSRLVAVRLGLLIAVCILVAGCGVRSSKPFTAKGSASCLTAHAFTRVTTNPAAAGFIARSEEHTSEL